MGRYTLHTDRGCGIMPSHEPTYPFSFDYGATAAALVRDVGSDGRRPPGVSHGPRGAADLLCLEAALYGWRGCCLAALCQSCPQNDPPDTSGGRAAGHPASPATSPPRPTTPPPPHRP